jgi:histidinol-phosphate/aromatic aminotransferase/cobyric acid decarboxylase-like protein
LLERVVALPSKAMTLLVTRTVYSVYLPETRALVDALWAERPHGWYEKNYEKGQDAMHGPCLARWRAWAGEAGVHLGDGFVHEVPIAGASEGIHALLALEAAPGKRRVHVFDGEYEGYGYLASALGLEVVVHRRDDDDLAIGPDETFWISQPSAIDGQLWPGLPALLERVAAARARAIVDLTYVGATAIATDIDLDHPAITAVLWSLSKPFGAYYHRIGGLLSRAEIPTLRGQLWFKNLFSLHLGERLMATYGARELPTKLLPTQARAIASAQRAGVIPDDARPSDVVLLAHAPRGSRDRFEEFTRGDGLRFCVSPAIDQEINR